MPVSGESWKPKEAGRHVSSRGRVKLGPSPRSVLKIHSSIARRDAVGIG